jgi:hypothetical protein
MIDISPNLVNTGVLVHIDPLNQSCYSPNVFPRPLDIWGWNNSLGGGISNGTSVRDSVVTPIGNTPIKNVSNAIDQHTTGYGGAQFNVAPASNGETWTISYYAKALNPNNIIEFVLFTSNESGFLGAGGIYGSSQIPANWARMSYTGTFSNASMTALQTRLDQNISGITYWMDGYQIEKSPVATRFNPNYYGPSVVKDLGSRKNNCTLFGRPVFSDLNGGSIELVSGSSQYLESNATILRNADNFTISTWINFPSVPTNSGIIQHGKDGFGSGWGATIGMGASTSQVIASVVTNVANRQITYNAPSALLANTWYNFALSYQQGTGTALYLNGALVGSASFSDIGLRESTKGLMIGNNIGTSPGFTSEKFGHTLVYDRSLTAAEISQNFNALRRRYGI